MSEVARTSRAEYLHATGTLPSSDKAVECVSQPETIEQRREERRSGVLASKPVQGGIPVVVRSDCQQTTRME